MYLHIYINIKFKKARQQAVFLIARRIRLLIFYLAIYVFNYLCIYINTKIAIDILYHICYNGVNKKRKLVRNA